MENFIPLSSSMTLADDTERNFIYHHTICTRRDAGMVIHDDESMSLCVSMGKGMTAFALTAREISSF